MLVSSEEELRIGPNDTVIILREDGSCEASFPEMEDGATVPSHIITGAAIMYALEDEELSELIHENFAIQCEEMAYTDAVNDNATAKPPSCA